MAARLDGGKYERRTAGVLRADLVISLPNTTRSGVEGHVYAGRDYLLSSSEAFARRE
jgi:hypothetical protein